MSFVNVEQCIINLIGIKGGSVCSERNDDVIEIKYSANLLLWRQCTWAPENEPVVGKFLQCFKMS